MTPHPGQVNLSQETEGSWQWNAPESMVIDHSAHIHHMQFKNSNSPNHVLSERNLHERDLGKLQTYTKPDQGFNLLN